VTARPRAKRIGKLAVGFLDLARAARSSAANARDIGGVSDALWWGVTGRRDAAVPELASTRGESSHHSA
jgi:hypothetical protein